MNRNYYGLSPYSLTFIDYLNNRDFIKQIISDTMLYHNQGLIYDTCDEISTQFKLTATALLLKNQLVKTGTDIPIYDGLQMLQNLVSYVQHEISQNIINLLETLKGCTEQPLNIVKVTNYNNTFIVFDEELQRMLKLIEYGSIQCPKQTEDGQDLIQMIKFITNVVRPIEDNLEGYQYNTYAFGMEFDYIKYVMASLESYKNSFSEAKEILKGQSLSNLKLGDIPLKDYERMNYENRNAYEEKLQSEMKSIDNVISIDETIKAKREYLDTIGKYIKIIVQRIQIKNVSSRKLQNDTKKNMMNNLYYSLENVATLADNMILSYDMNFKELLKEYCLLDEELTYTESFGYNKSKFEVKVSVADGKYEQVSAENARLAHARSFYVMLENVLFIMETAKFDKSILETVNLAVD